MAGKYGSSALWERYSRTHITDESVTDLTGFKSTETNFKLALWDPRPNGIRYLKALIFDLADRLSPSAMAALRRIPNRDVGDPITVRVSGEAVCLDYLQAVLELEFIGDHLDLGGATVLEIGAGYGRTCHAILSNHEVAQYHIVDLDNSLRLATAYLRAVLTDEQFAKLRFSAVDDLEATLSGNRYDLCINVDSFAEMDSEIVLNYLDLIDRTCRHFYVKNPVGKYLDKSLDSHSQGDELVSMALRTGLLREVIDIHDSQAVADQAQKFIAAYRPSLRWTGLADARAIPWSYYWQALYRCDR
ncbi:putative sugar O-methyltransferase [Nocardia terpenica]|uniref:putative sugar O-methyltransferase n=1 Tax=Nocardia terpenica TaxID=455432 RepID=UPI001895A4ED|nr:putative sugar O-methyltransferase [Nocardia terpenica]MBF6063294.1 putative sugar O-methyltransferase [Nocardia terpenica]MBF6105850.1 putative sugar O-methyltransferase [Nocardia terpenica]MBF6113566.1 putative sugar O-methyltransferase [Nocardia terpenica]MBF6119591.1 putative sugar O-methyltransferase [Nocardia terpenica]MBF6152002.1 putative sugar O-methyltransferase [Nocardia terpenica]